MNRKRTIVVLVIVVVVVDDGDAYMRNDGGGGGDDDEGVARGGGCSRSPNLGKAEFWRDSPDTDADVGWCRDGASRAYACLWAHPENHRTLFLSNNKRRTKPPRRGYSLSRLARDTCAALRLEKPLR